MIAILDFGSQYTKLIARRIRQLEMYSVILKHDVTAERLEELGTSAIILSGSPRSVYSSTKLEYDSRILDMDVPVLGICYGMQLLVKHFGGRVLPGKSGEYGLAELKHDGEGIFADASEKVGMGKSLTVWMSHGDRAHELGELVSCGHTTDCEHAAVRHPDKPIFGVQFHPEVAHTQSGIGMLRSFVGLARDLPIWTMDNYLTTAVDDVRRQVGQSKVICGMSGGVDSSVMAAIMGRAVGSNAVCVFINNGLLREGEAEQVISDFGQYSKGKLEYVDASQLFLEALKGVTDPQQKRLIIGEKFVQVFQEVADRHEGIGFLAQGTLYPDVIESGGDPDGPAALIKHHHNVSGLPAHMKLKIVEPLRHLFKDEVRALAKELGLPQRVIQRQPFPGPGLAVRVLGEITEKRLAAVRKADSIFQEEWGKSYSGNWSGQRFCVLLPINTVGVMGDGRTYEWTVAIRSVDTEDFMTARPSRLGHEFLERVATKIVNEVDGVNRVVYDLTSKPPATIEWE